MSDVKDRPILFSAPMVRAILESRKTQTRRVVMPPKGWPQFSQCDPFAMPPAVWWWNGEHERVGVRQECPYGQPGDRLWVRETFALESSVEDNKPPFNDGRPVFRPAPTDEYSPSWFQPHYKATDQTPDLCCERTNCRDCADQGYGPHWRASIHMPRWASRITLEVVSVRVERLQDISEADARAEGVTDFGNVTNDNTGEIDRDAVEAYESLWESIHGPGSWEENPWVWVVEFRRVRP
jgi:hypothetical protein